MGVGLEGLSDSLAIAIPDFIMISFSISDMSDSAADELLLLCVNRSIKLFKASLALALEFLELCEEFSSISIEAN